MVDIRCDNTTCEAFNESMDHFDTVKEKEETLKYYKCFDCQQKKILRIDYSLGYPVEEVLNDEF